MQIQTEELIQVPQNFGLDGWLRKPAVVVTAESKADGEKCEVGARLDYAEWDPLVERWISETVATFVPHWDTVIVRRLPGEWIRP